MYTYLVIYGLLFGNCFTRFLRVTTQRNVIRDHNHYLVKTIAWTGEDIHVRTLHLLPLSLPNR